MLAMGPHEFGAWLGAHWELAAWLAVAIMGATGWAMVLLPRVWRDDLALWMMGATSDGTWAARFTALFDAFFGRRHLSLRCFLISTLVSLVTVTAFWVSLGTIDGFSQRFAGIDAFWKVLALGVAVNAVADFVSLLETRVLLGWLKVPRRWWVQVLVLVGDLVTTAAIIWAALWAVQALGLTTLVLGAEREGWAEVVGVFSPLAIFFYSTFVTSIWTWGFILSTWLMRVLSRLSWLHDVFAEHPRKAFPLVLGAAALVTGFAGSTAAGVLMARDAQNLSFLDRALCSLSKGPVCLNVRSLTEDEATRLALTLDACRGGLTEECIERGRSVGRDNGAVAAQYWRVACESGDEVGCGYFGFLNEQGVGIERNLSEAVRLYRLGCDGEHGLSCTRLGILLENGLNPDFEDISKLYSLGCKGEDAGGCYLLARLYHRGLGLDQDLGKAAHFYRLGCEDEIAHSCARLGVLFELGEGVDPDPEEAAKLYRLGCEGEIAAGCYNLGRLFEQGLGVDQDFMQAARFYRLGCEDEIADSCTRLGVLFEQGRGLDQDLQKAAQFYRLACDGEDAIGCTLLGTLYQSGDGVEQNSEEASRFFRFGCALGDANGCVRQWRLYQDGVGIEPDHAQAARVFSKGCDQGNGDYCGNLGYLYETGLGRAPDLQEARRLYVQGCELGAQGACELMEGLSGHQAFD